MHSVMNSKYKFQSSVLNSRRDNEANTFENVVFRKDSQGLYYVAGKRKTLLFRFSSRQN